MDDLTEMNRKLTRLSGVEVNLSSFGGQCPVQAYGSVAYNGREANLYFRARHEAWTMEIGECPPFVGRGKETDWSHEEDWPYGPFQAGYMSTEDAETCVVKAPGLMEDRSRKEVMNSEGAAARAYTIGVLTRLAEPILTTLSEGRLKAQIPFGGPPDRADFTHLEAFGRLLAGIAPWLELGPDASEEGQLRARYLDLTVQAIRHAVDPASPDYMNFNRGAQPLVDAAFLAHGLLRAPEHVWGRLEERDRANIVAALQATRVIKPFHNNWLLFSAMVEAALWHFTGTCDMGPMRKGVRQHLLWYKGDGTYGDGPSLHWDYYNSFVIHPMLLDIVRMCAGKKRWLGRHYPVIRERAQRYASVQERMISPEATFPVIGRSSCYRFGAFHLLSHMALRRQLPADVQAGGVRAGLTAVIRRMIEAPGTFDEAGWLRLGVVGHQPALAEGYISTGSLYLCATGLLHLGLPANDPFWTGPDQPWTQKRIWAGEDVPADHAMIN